MPTADTQLSAAYAALTDPTRREIVRRLALGPCTVEELRRPFPISAPAISRHLRVLEAAGMLTRERRGSHRICQLEGQALRAAEKWLSNTRDDWSAQFDRLDALLAGEA